MKITSSHFRIALFVLLAILLLWGGFKLLLGISFGPLVDQLLPNGVMLGTVVIFGWNRWLLAQEKKKESSQDEESPKSE